MVLLNEGKFSINIIAIAYATYLRSQLSMFCSAICTGFPRAANSKQLGYFAELKLELEKIVSLNSNKIVRVR